ncbi:MAG: dUTP diphosphatase [Acidobacteriota bacterium]
MPKRTFRTGHYVTTATTIRVVRLPHGGDLPLPRQATPGSAGSDLHAALDTPITLAPGERQRIPTGLALEIPLGYEGQVRPRSGLAARHGVTVLNTPGTIDSDYRGEVQVLLINLGDQPVELRRGDRIAQLVVAKVEAVTWREVDDLAASERDTGGFGSSGR